MHLNSNAFSKNGTYTIVPKKPGVKIGQRDNLSRQDLAEIYEIYYGKNFIFGAILLQAGILFTSVLLIISINKNMIWLDYIGLFDIGLFHIGLLDICLYCFILFSFLFITFMSFFLI